MKFGSLTPKGLRFPCLSPGTSKMAISFCSAETVGACLSYIWLKDTTIGCGTAIEI